MSLRVRVAGLLLLGASACSTSRTREAAPTPAPAAPADAGVVSEERAPDASLDATVATAPPVTEPLHAEVTWRGKRKYDGSGAAFVVQGGETTVLVFVSDSYAADWYGELSCETVKSRYDAPIGLAFWGIEIRLPSLAVGVHDYDDLILLWVAEDDGHGTATRYGKGTVRITAIDDSAMSGEARLADGAWTAILRFTAQRCP